ncbi:MAG: peptide deformylase [Parcubacteria group bacterium]|nr:peptide deformylase [Parcubacteria group bacterium]
MNWNLETLFENFQRIRTEIPELKLFGEKPLHSQSEDVMLEEGKEIAEKLTSTLLKYREVTGVGRGIAAPQIGLQKNVFITYVNDEVQTYINPVITKHSDETNFYRELCMSSSLMWADIERPQSITMTWTDETGKDHGETFDDFIARLLQHEYDHLKGCVCLDKAIPGTIAFVSSNPLDEKLRKG